MTVQEVYIEAIKYKHNSLVLFIDFLVQEKKVIRMTDPSDNLQFYLQEKFTLKMNRYLGEYKNKRSLEFEEKEGTRYESLLRI